MLPLIGIFRLLDLYGRLVAGIKPGKSPSRKRTEKTKKTTTTTTATIKNNNSWEGRGVVGKKLLT